MHSQYALCRLVGNLYTLPACLLSHFGSASITYALADHSQSQQSIAGLIKSLLALACLGKSLLALACLGACGWALSVMFPLTITHIWKMFCKLLCAQSMLYTDWV
ncbi:hypothetical protein PROFUN_03869 [Planoprotostelium fungivorum]|uniref:Uncharacterized protein n=1 Tax=Planoprotostelium fungivorum TaxID=1890364 RepID=A0A2P6NID9_9EUKA|nr:hypothetical protein PROFUN_03869 [Planoprotostelium fungivorum]